jgi:thioredoxin 1
MIRSDQTHFRILPLTWLILLMAIGTISCTEDRSTDPEASVGKPSVIHTIIDNADLAERLAVAGDGLVMIEFYADWCGPCRQLAPIIEKIARKYEKKVTVFKVDVDANRPLAKRFAVRGIPYVVFIRSGDTLHSLIGVQPQKNYESAIARFSLP